MLGVGTGNSWWSPIGGIYCSTCTIVRLPMTRLIFLAGLFTWSLAGTISSSAQPITIRFTGAFIEGSSFAATAREFASNVNERLNSIVRIEVIPTPQNPLTRVAQAEVEMALVPSAILANTKSRDLALFDLPFLF